MTNDSAIVEWVLALLRQFGWETACKKLDAQPGAPPPTEQNAEIGEFFRGWMAAERGNFAEAVRLGNSGSN